MKIVEKKHVGCYGVVYNNNNQVLLVRKAKGAYKGKLDLPGGGIEYGESVDETLRREFLEEVGLIIKEYNLRKVITNYVTWNIGDKYQERLQHIAIIHDVKLDDNDFDKIKKEADGLDSLGAEWYDVSELSRDELSPLAMCVKD